MKNLIVAYLVAVLLVSLGSTFVAMSTHGFEEGHLEVRAVAEEVRHG